MKTKNVSKPVVKTQEVGRIVLCGVKGCCPQIDFTKPSVVTISDDFGGSVRLTRRQWRDLKNKFS